MSLRRKHHFADCVTSSTTSPGRPMYRYFVENVTSTTATLSRLN
uniref:Uncharacterized protein n=1 Tax=Acrobeloides nanus TaxID=290746 RepID=A0A914CU32_9BILA